MFVMSYLVPAIGFLNWFICVVYSFVLGSDIRISYRFINLIAYRRFDMELYIVIGSIYVVCIQVSLVDYLM